MSHWLASASLRFRLSALFGLIFALSAAALLLAVAHRQAVFADGLVRSQAHEIAANIASLTRAAVAANDRIALATRLESFNEFEDLRSIVIADRQGTPLAAVQRNAAGNLSATPRQQIFLPADPAEAHGGGLAPRAGHATIRAAIGQIAPIGWVYLEVDTARTGMQRKHMLTGLAVTAILLCFAATLAFTLFLRVFLAPEAESKRGPADAVESPPGS